MYRHDLIWNPRDCAGSMKLTLNLIQNDLCPGNLKVRWSFLYVKSLNRPIYNIGWPSTKKKNIKECRIVYLLGLHLKLEQPYTIQTLLACREQDWSIVPLRTRAEQSNRKIFIQFQALVKAPIEVTVKLYLYRSKRIMSGLYYHENYAAFYVRSLDKEAYSIFRFKFLSPAIESIWVIYRHANNRINSLSLELIHFILVARNVLLGTNSCICTLEIGNATLKCAS